MLRPTPRKGKDRRCSANGSRARRNTSATIHTSSHLSRLPRAHHRTRPTPSSSNTATRRQSGRSPSNSRNPPSGPCPPSRNTCPRRISIPHPHKAPPLSLNLPHQPPPWLPLTGHTDNIHIHISSHTRTPKH